MSLDRARRASAARGFTLTELMVVVTLVGIFATLGIVSFRKQVFGSKTSEALAVVQAIRAAQEAYRSENQVYLDVTTDSANWYPSNQFGEDRLAWRVNTHTDLDRWNALNVQVTTPVLFRFLVDAGVPGQAPPALVMSNPPTLPTPSDPWYVIQARADYDEDDTYCDVAAWSQSREIAVQDEGE